MSLVPRRATGRPSTRSTVLMTAALLGAGGVILTAGPALAAGPSATPVSSGAALSASIGPRTPSDAAAQLTTGMMPPGSPDATHAERPSSSAAHAAVVSPAVTASYLLGVDVASYQHPYGRAITWSSVRATGQSFAVIKATESTTYANGYLSGDAAGARAAGLTVGLYHFARPSLVSGSPTADAIAEADHFAGQVRSIGGTQLPPTLDLETSGGLSAAQLVSWTATFLVRVQADTGRRPMIYTGPYFWDTALAGSRSFTTYPLWEAHYTKAAQPQAFGGWAGWTLWQYTDGTYGSPPAIGGISGAVDRDRFVSGLSQLATLAAESSGNDAPYSGTASPALYPDGTFVQIAGSTGVYEIAGLAPVFLPSWSLVGGVHPVRVLSAAQFYSLRSQPRDGTFVRAADTGQVYRVAGGAPLYVSSWTPFGRGYPSVPLGSSDFLHAGVVGPYSHLRAHPLDGTFLNTLGSGGVYRVAGGAPIYVSSWAYFGGGQPYTSVSPVDISAAGSTVAAGVFAHLSARPAEGTLIETAFGGTYWRQTEGRLVAVIPTPGQSFVVEGDSAVANRGAAGVWAHLA